MEYEGKPGTAVIQHYYHAITAMTTLFSDVAAACCVSWLHSKSSICCECVPEV